MKRLADSLAALSLVCAFLAVTLAAFDIFPRMNWHMMPPYPSYYIALLGMACWCFSGRWLPGLRRHWLLLLLVGLVIGLGGISTWVGALSHDSERLFTFFTRQYIKWRVMPFLFLCWMASLFADLPKDKAKRAFSLALVCLFIPNAVHAALEMLANAGAHSVKSFLVSINPSFRMETALHGWWPPTYFTGRVRGLFAEPGFMAMGLLPLFALFAYGALRDKRTLAPLLFLAAVYCVSLSYGGLIAMTVFFGLLVAWSLWRLPAGRRNACLAVLLLALGLSAWTAWHSSRVAEISHGVRSRLRTNEVVAAYLRDAHDGKNPTPPVLDHSYRVQHSGFTRLLSLRLDLDMGAKNPLLGVGYQQRGFYWRPLEQVDAQGAEWGLWVRYAAHDPFRFFPTLSEYTGTLAEAGAPCLFVELVLLAFVAVRAFRYFLSTRDAYVGCMACAYMAMLVGLHFNLIVSIPMFPLFAGFVYAVSSRSETGDQYDVRL